MKRNETKTRTVWYVQRGQEAIRAFETKALAQAFANDIDFDVDIVQSKIIGSSSYPEMVNARYEDSLKATEPVVEESKPSGQIVWRYKVQFKKFRKQGRLLLDIPIAGWLDGGVFETKEEAEKSAKVFMRMPTRIRKVGELI